MSGRWGGSETRYDAFISYSHAADGLLAPRLQAGLQRFAKPWWKRRAARVFRDEASLAANPHLWSSITEALDTSGWFVLLLSPDAAASEWVGREIEHWREHNDPARILPVVTGGEFGWADGDVTGSAVHEALRNVFTEEPRWVDLRFARGEDALDLKNPRFSAAIADIASAIRGVPKDELESEEVKQHRRTRRTAWAAGIAVLVLAIASGAQTLRASDLADVAQAERDLAEQLAAEAQSQRDAAEEARDEADQKTAEALFQEQIANAGRLGAASVAARSDDPELAMLLALHALHVLPDGADRSGLISELRAAAIEHRLLSRTPVPDGVVAARLSPNGLMAYHIASSDGRLVATNLETMTEEWDYEPPQGRRVFFPNLDPRVEDGRFPVLSLSPNGRHLAFVEWGDGKPATVVILDTASRERRDLTPSTCADAMLAPGFSPDGRFLSVVGGEHPCLYGTGAGTGGLDEAAMVAENSRAYIYDARSWQLERAYEAPLPENPEFSAVNSSIYEFLSFTRARDLALASSNSAKNTQTGRSFLVNYPNLEIIEDLGLGQNMEISPSGRHVIFHHLEDGVFNPTEDPVDIRILDIAGDYPLPIHGARLVGYVTIGSERFLDDPTRPVALDVPIDLFAFSPDSALVSVIGHGRDLVARVDGSTAMRGYDDGVTWDHAWSEESTLLLTAHSGELRLWAVSETERPFPPGTQDDAVATLAAQLLTRGFTQVECDAYAIADPCPTLEEMRARS